MALRASTGLEFSDAAIEGFKGGYVIGGSFTGYFDAAEVHKRMLSDFEIHRFEEGSHEWAVNMMQLGTDRFVTSKVAIAKGTVLAMMGPHVHLSSETDSNIEAPPSLHMETAVKFNTQLVWTPSMDDDPRSLASWVVHKDSFGSQERVPNVDYHTALYIYSGLYLTVPIIVANRDIHPGQMLVGDFGDSFFLQPKYMKSNAAQLAKFTRKRKRECESAQGVVIENGVHLVNAPAPPVEKKHRGLQTDPEPHVIHLENALEDAHHGMEKIESKLSSLDKQHVQTLSEAEEAKNEVARLNAVVQELINKSQNAEERIKQYRQRALDAERHLDVSESGAERLRSELARAEQELNDMKKKSTSNNTTLMAQNQELVTQLTKAIQDRNSALQAHAAVQANLNAVMLQQQQQQAIPMLMPWNQGM